jgi:hypothetical protein
MPNIIGGLEIVLVLFNGGVVEVATRI